jgi:hypothetical protein
VGAEPARSHRVIIDQRLGQEAPTITRVSGSAVRGTRIRADGPKCSRSASPAVQVGG